MTAETKKRSPIVGIAIVGAIAAVGIGAAVIPNMRPYDPNNSAEAIAQCEALIKERLKAPATARFDSDATGNERWTVTGTVDAENGFGALVRSSYSCTVTINSADNIVTRIDSFEG